MFHLHSVEGRVFSGTLDELRQHRKVNGIARVRPASPLAVGNDPSAQIPPGASGLGREAARAYAGVITPHERQPLTRVADVMHAPALTVPSQVTVREAWEILARHGIGQAPVLDAAGALVGIVGRAELMPLATPNPAGELGRLAQPVTDVMWSPVPSAAPDTDLRRVAALLLDTGLPGLPVADENGRVFGFVSRTDLLRAIATDPPLDLWG